MYHQESAIKRKRSGLTLLVVAILLASAVVLFKGGQQLGNADQARDAVHVNALATAIENFYGEYSQLPKVPATLETDSESGIALLRILLADEPAGSKPQNPRDIVFLAVREAKGDRGGVAYASGDSDDIKGMFDSQGRPFQVVVNTGYTDVFEFEHAGTKVRLRGRFAAVFAAGEDGKLGTKDDLISW